MSAGKRIQRPRKTVKVPSGSPADKGSGKRVQPKRPPKPAEETSASGGAFAVAPESLNVAHVPYGTRTGTKKPDPVTRSTIIFKNGVPTGKLRKKRTKK